MKISMMQSECKRCGHKWLPRVVHRDKKGVWVSSRPLRCAKCKSPYWDTAPKPKAGK